MLFPIQSWWFPKRNKAYPLINELDIKKIRPNLITAVSIVLMYLKLYCKQKILVDFSDRDDSHECTQTSDIAKTYDNLK